MDRPSEAEIRQRIEQLDARAAARGDAGDSQAAELDLARVFELLWVLGREPAEAVTHG